MLQKKGVEKIKTHIFMFSDLYIFENGIVYEIMWKNIVEPEKPLTTIWRMRIAYCIPKATDIHSEYVIIIGFALQQWLHEHATLSRYTRTCIACLVIYTFFENIFCSDKY
jgi:hypothetical protein